MKKTAIPLCIILLYILALIITSGCFMIVGGAAAFLLWAVPVVISILYARKEHSFFRITVVLTLIYALLSVSLLKKDDFFGRKLLKRYRDGSDYIAVYESNPGAAGHYSYEKRTYHIILDSRVFSVKLLKSSERFASSDGIPSAEK